MVEYVCELEQQFNIAFVLCEGSHKTGQKSRKLIACVNKYIIVHASLSLSGQFLHSKSTRTSSPRRCLLKFVAHLFGLCQSATAAAAVAQLTAGRSFRPSIQVTGPYSTARGTERDKLVPSLGSNARFTLAYKTSAVLQSDGCSSNLVRSRPPSEHPKTAREELTTRRNNNTRLTLQQP